MEHSGGEFGYKNLLQAGVDEAATVLGHRWRYGFRRYHTDGASAWHRLVNDPCRQPIARSRLQEEEGLTVFDKKKRGSDGTFVTNQLWSRSGSLNVRQRTSQGQVR